MAFSKPRAMPLLALVAALCSAGSVQATFFTKVVTSYSDPYDPCDNLGPCQYCDTSTGTKKVANKDPMTPCDDGKACNGHEYCNAHGICEAGTDVVCDSYNTLLPPDAEAQCVGKYTCVESYTAAEGYECKAIFRGGDCQDNDACTVGEQCDPYSGTCEGYHKRCISGHVCHDGECVGPCGSRECDDDGENCIWSACGECNDCVGLTCKPKKDPECPPCHSCGHGDTDCVYDCNEHQECGLDGHGAYTCVDKACDPHWANKCHNNCMNCANNHCYGNTCDEDLVCNRGNCVPEPCVSRTKRTECRRQCKDCVGDTCVNGCEDDETCKRVTGEGFKCVDKCDATTIHDCRLLCRECDGLTGECTGGCTSDEVCEKADPADPYPTCMEKAVCDYDKVKECQGMCMQCKDGVCKGACSDHVPNTACNTYGTGIFARSLCLSCDLPGRTCCDNHECLGGLVCNSYSNTCQLPSAGYVSIS